jgi:hypothetical protein
LDSVVELEFDMNYLSGFENFSSDGKDIVVPKKGNYFLTVFIVRNDLICQFSETVHIENENTLIDTIVIPRILFCSEHSLNSINWQYQNCESVCDNYEVEYYQNGNKWMQGYFKNGKPEKISTFSENGNIEVNTFYELGYLKKIREEYYDENGELEEYYIFKYRNRKMIMYHYDKGNSLIEKFKSKY